MIIVSGMETPGFIFIKEDKRNYRVETDSIIYIEAVGDYVKFHTTRRDYITHQTLRKTEEILAEQKHFLRIHKSFIVNMNMVQAFEGNLLILPKKTLSVGQQYRADFNKYIELLSK